MEKKVGKEVKIGLAVIGVLVTSFGYVLVRRLAHESQAAAATAAATPDHGSDAEKTKGRSDKSEKPTLLAGLESGRPAELTPEQKSSSSSLPDSHRRELADAGAADPGNSASDSFMPPAHPRAGEAAKNDAALDHHAAPAGYGQPAYGDGSATASSGGPALGNSNGFGPAPGSAYGTSSGHNDVQPLHIDAAPPGASADPFQHRLATPAVTSASAANPAATAAAVPPLAPPDLPDPNHAAKSNPWGAATPLATDNHAPDGRGPDSPNDSHRRDTPHMNGIVADPAATNNPSFVTGDDMRADGTRLDRAQPIAAATNPSRSSFGQPEPGHVEITRPEPAHEVAVISAPVYAPPPASLQTGAGSLALPQQLVGDSAARKGQYLVQPNDNFWTISEKVYGTGGYFKAIFEYNRSRHPQADRLQVGESIETPDATTLQKTYPDLCPKPGRGVAASRVVPASARMQPGTRVYTVEEGDTLFEIARRELGKPARWGEIYQLNRDALGTDFDYLKPGSQLLIPADGGRTEPIAREPSNTFSR
jgi:nucleoid-associated protein YgaU